MIFILKQSEILSSYHPTPIALLQIENQLLQLFQVSTTSFLCTRTTLLNIGPTRKCIFYSASMSWLAKAVQKFIWRKSLCHYREIQKMSFLHLCCCNVLYSNNQPYAFLHGFTAERFQLWYGRPILLRKCFKWHTLSLVWTEVFQSARFSGALDSSAYLKLTQLLVWSQLM